MIVLLRHGETFWNREGRIQGHMESDLTPLGERQAAAMAGLAADLVRRDGRGDWRLVASPIGRAQRTAGIVAAATGLAIETDARLAEISCGAWEGKLRADIAHLHPEKFATREWFFGAPGGETFEDVAARAADWLASLPPEPGRRVIAVSHGVWGRLARGLYAGLDRQATLNQDVPQDAVYRLQDGQIDRFDCEPVL
ncbi:histidine phosphatase family protein [Phenylobacterium sp.]|uniref:histidine phosphatase family protein n=1 Tax=Phenylobacterium sp. TaxID=1871053 RepID=UPI0025E32E2B|nr:histidine phosphatase family protein [Phenylobacterium sp.]